MKAGNWVPISKAFLKHLPKDRAYTKLEAAFSVQVAYDNDQKATVSGFAASWRWSRKKVSRFLKIIGALIIYPENTGKKQNQRGQIRVQIRNRSEEKKGQIRLIDSRWLDNQRNRSEEKKGQIRNRSGSTIKDPNPKPKNNMNEYTPDFETAWKNHGRKDGSKFNAFKKWKELKRQDVLPELNEILRVQDRQKQSKKWKDGYIPYFQTWLNGRIWEEEVEICSNPHSGAEPQCLTDEKIQELTTRDA